MSSAFTSAISWGLPAAPVLDERFSTDHWYRAAFQLEALTICDSFGKGDAVGAWECLLPRPNDRRSPLRRDAHANRALRSKALERNLMRGEGRVRVERLFEVLVLGGAALACDDSKGGEFNAGSAGSPSSHAGDTGKGLFDAGPNGGAIGAGSSGTGNTSPGSADSAGRAGADDGAASNANGGGSDAGGTSGDTGSGSTGGMNAAGIAGGGTFSAGDTAGSGGGLLCHIDATGFGRSSDPCGCPCCWAKDCLNTDKICCGGFCKVNCCGQ